MAQHIPKHALTFMASAARLATQHGLKAGVTKAAGKVNPTLMVIEAAVSVLEAINSYLKLRKARAHRDGLRQVLNHEEERLRLERDKLSDQLDLAKSEIDQRQRIQRRLGELVFACAQACRSIWSELYAIRSADIPDIEAFETEVAKLEDAWGQLQRALSYYNQTAG